MELLELLQFAHQNKASDLHLKVGSPPTIRKAGHLEMMETRILMPDDTEAFAKEILGEDRFSSLETEGEIDIAYSVRDIGRYRVNIYKQRNTYGIAMRTVNINIPSLKDLNVPEVVGTLTDLTHGLILVTGPTGSGKSTTLAAMIQMINMKRRCHIITLEDPIEYLYKNQMAIIGQREVGLDTKSFGKGLRAALRQDPDIILVGEMRDLETIEIALLAAETGHLVLSTLHTLGAAKTVDRIIDAFPADAKEQVRTQLSSVLQAVVSQQLLRNKSENGVVPACEVMLSTTGIRNLIRESKSHQIQNSIVMGMNQGMITMDTSLKNLYQRGFITRQAAINHALDRDELLKKIDM